MSAGTTELVQTSRDVLDHYNRILDPLCSYEERIQHQKVNMSGSMYCDVLSMSAINHKALDTVCKVRYMHQLLWLLSIL